MVYGKIGSFEKAIEQFSKAIDIKPNFSLAYGYRGLVYFLIGDDERALENLNKAIELGMFDEHFNKK